MPLGLAEADRVSVADLDTDGKGLGKTDSDGVMEDVWDPVEVI